MVSAAVGRLRRFVAQSTPDSQHEVTGTGPSRDALSLKDLKETARKILDQAAVQRDELCTYIVNEYGPYAQCKPDGSQTPQASVLREAGELSAEDMRGTVNTYFNKARTRSHIICGFLQWTKFLGLLLCRVLLAVYRRS